ncbi:hypothetical protein HHI36_017486, partial [Cryptolaemus montrouzieri]
ERSKKCFVTSKLHVRSARQKLLGLVELSLSIPSGTTTSISQTRRDSTGPVAVVESCYICKELKRMQRKTQRVCALHAVTPPTCNACFASGDTSS